MWRMNCASVTVVLPPAVKEQSSTKPAAGCSTLQDIPLNVNCDSNALQAVTAHTLGSWDVVI